ncbi:MAG TPA: hypothetical protein PKW17_12470 [Smithellaceae bacterium]|jgi:hypothetical protein|nr:hypothetical protein [Smithellaceae bacterium]HQK41902.1 hypothetical protein [bacterium]
MKKLKEVLDFLIFQFDYIAVCLAVGLMSFMIALLAMGIISYFW